MKGHRRSETPLAKPTSPALRSANRVLKAWHARAMRYAWTQRWLKAENTRPGTAAAGAAVSTFRG